MAAFFLGCFVGAYAVERIYSFLLSIPKRPSDEPPSVPMADYRSINLK
jgi:hypothetical protein